MLSASLFRLLKTGNNLNVHQQESGLTIWSVLNRTKDPINMNYWYPTQMYLKNILLSKGSQIKNAYRMSPWKWKQTNLWCTCQKRLLGEVRGLRRKGYFLGESWGTRGFRGQLSAGQTAPFHHLCTHIFGDSWVRVTQCIIAILIVQNSFEEYETVCKYVENVICSVDINEAQPSEKCKGYLFWA